MFEIWWMDDETYEDHLIAIFLSQDDAKEYLSGLDEDYYYMETVDAL